MDLHNEAKLGNDKEEESLSMRMGSMVAEASAPAGGGTVDGLAEDARLPMLAARRSALRRYRKRKKTKCGERGKVTPSLLFIAELGGGSGSDAPTISVSCAGNGCTTCPTSGGGSFDPFITITTRAVCEEAACVAERHSSALTKVTVGGSSEARGTSDPEQIRRRFRDTRQKP